MDPRILFEDTHLIVLDKPAGLLSQGEHTGDENLVDWLRQYLGRPYVGLIHRLDRNTSGIMIVAKRTKSAQRLTDQLQSGKLERTYLAWLEGKLSSGTHPWKHLLLKDEARNLVRVVSSGGPNAKAAALSVTSLSHAQWKGSELTLAEFKLETGRSHQIRAQASYEGHPLVGDRKYGARLVELASHFGRPALHSRRLTFEHPMSHEPLTFEAPLPEDFKRIAPAKPNL